MLDNVPYEVCLGDKVLWGDVEAFMESFESGAEAKEYDRLCAFELSLPDEQLKQRIGVSVRLPGCV